MADERATRVAIESDADIVTARQRERRAGGELELTSTDQTLIATAISEVARNIITYAKRGEVLLELVRDDGGREGIGWSRATRARASRTSSRRCRTATRRGGGLGLGLPGARRLVDEFEIETAPSEGTTNFKWSER